MILWGHFREWNAHSPPRDISRQLEGLAQGPGGILLESDLTMPDERALDGVRIKPDANRFKSVFLYHASRRYV
jgi:hypothetical protein